MKNDTQTPIPNIAERLSESEPIEIKNPGEPLLVSYDEVLVRDANSRGLVKLNHHQLLYFVQERVSRMIASIEYRRFVEDYIRSPFDWNLMNRDTFYDWLNGLSDAQYFALEDINGGTYDDQISEYQRRMGRDWIMEEEKIPNSSDAKRGLDHRRRRRR